MLDLDDIMESLQEIAQVAHAVGEDAISANLENEIGNLKMVLGTSHGLVITVDEAKTIAWALYWSHNEGQDYDSDLARRLHEWIASQDPDWSWDRKRFLRQGEDPHAAPYVYRAEP